MDVLISHGRLARPATLLMAFFFVAACSGGGASTAAPTAPATAPPTVASAAIKTAAPTAGGPALIAVTLQEWAVVPSIVTVPAGSVTFAAKNVGTELHEMVVIKTDVGLLELPVGSDGKVDEEGANLEAMGEVSELAVGATGTVTLDLTPGHYLLICNIVDADGTAHYGKGMTTALTVN